MEDRKEYKSELFEAVPAMTLAQVRQIKTDVQLQLILKQLDQILAEIGNINKALRDNQCANLKL
jgi:hypothetical protein